MYLTVDFQAITNIFVQAQLTGRYSLYEYEVYNLLYLSGSETPPKALFIPKNSRPAEEEIMALPGDKAVLKIVSPTIIHKTEVGGVRIIPKSGDKVRSVVRRMLCEVPEMYAQWIELNPKISTPYTGLSDTALQNAIAKDIQGVLQVQFMPPDSTAFGNELIVGLRRTREFGMVISAGLGGTDTELYAERFRKGQAIAASLTAMSDGQEFFEVFRKTVSYRKLAGLTRGQRRIVTDEQLIECFESFIRLGNYYSPINPEAPFIIEELEINPFTFTDYLMVPLDGMCRFSMPEALDINRPIAKIDKLLHPKSIGIVGVSTTKQNFGKTILDAVLDSNYPPEQITLIREGLTEFNGLRCVSQLTDLSEPLDLLVVAIPAEQVPALVQTVLDAKAAHSVMLIPGGLGETEASKALAEAMVLDIKKAHVQQDDGGAVFLGANCMGVISRPGQYNTWFIPTEKLVVPQNTYRPVAIVSQSGAFLLNRYSQAPEMRPAYLISMGNQTDLTLGDMLSYFSTSEAVNVIAIYAEGFRDLDGLAFAKSVCQAVSCGKQVIFYKAGRTPEGKTATSGHTASLAGDYMVCESAISQAGAIIAHNFTEFQDLILLAESFHTAAINGKRLGAISGAGFEAVGMADSIQSDDYSMSLGNISMATQVAMQEIIKLKGLDKLVTIANPLDINPGADDEVHAHMAELMLLDENIDAVVVGLDPHSPVTHTLLQTPDKTLPDRFDLDHPQGILALLRQLKQKSSKPLVAVVDGGVKFEPLRQALKDSNIPVFPVCDRAVTALSLYMQGRLNAEGLRCFVGI